MKKQLLKNLFTSMSDMPALIVIIMFFCLLGLYSCQREIQNPGSIAKNPDTVSKNVGTAANSSFSLPPLSWKMRTSAYAVLSAATADAFSNLFGDNYRFTVRTHPMNKVFCYPQFRQFQLLS
jgi:hypothetical protein